MGWLAYLILVKPFSDPRTDIFSKYMRIQCAALSGKGQIVKNGLVREVGQRPDSQTSP
jgi:hypothetical protein